ncbi:hypothetical protein HZS_5549 [Henneguya salminicola]|nr:hypothetical protein HZS_5549 [Henneguya salminicola]
MKKNEKKNNINPDKIRKRTGKYEDVEQALKNYFFSSSSSSVPDKRAFFYSNGGVTCAES